MSRLISLSYNPKHRHIRTLNYIKEQEEEEKEEEEEGL